MSSIPSINPRRRDDHEARARRDAVAQWYGVPSDTFTGFSTAAVDEILDAIRDTPSRWAGIPRTTGKGR